MDSERGGTNRSLPALVLLAVTVAAGFWAHDRFTSPAAIRFVDRAAPAPLVPAGSAVPSASPTPPNSSTPRTAAPTLTREPERRDTPREPRRSRSHPATSSPPPVEQVTIPVAVGLAEEELRNALTRRGLGWEIVYVAATEPPGTVVTVDPAEGERIETGGVVKVSVSTGEPVTASPDPTGGDTD